MDTHKLNNSKNLTKINEPETCTHKKQETLKIQSDSITKRFKRIN